MPALYQQAKRIEVIISKQDNATQQQDGSTANTLTAGNATTNDGGSYSRSTSAQERFARVNVSKAIGVAREISNHVINYAVHKTTLTSGDESLGQAIDRQLEIVQDVGSVGTSIGMGALYGSAGGPVGALIGAGLGAISSGASLIFKYANRKLDFDFKQFKDENGVQYQKARANINMTTGRLR